MVQGLTCENSRRFPGPQRRGTGGTRAQAFNGTGKRIEPSGVRKARSVGSVDPRQVSKSASGPGALFCNWLVFCKMAKAYWDTAKVRCFEIPPKSNNPNCLGGFTVSLSIFELQGASRPSGKNHPLAAPECRPENQTPIGTPGWGEGWGSY